MLLFICGARFSHFVLSVFTTDLREGRGSERKATKISEFRQNFSESSYQHLSFLFFPYFSICKKFDFT